MQNAVATPECWHPQIDNDAPFHIFYKLSNFYILQSNYHTLEEIKFTAHPTREIIDMPEHTSNVAVFRLIPKGDRMAVNAEGDLEAYENLYR